MSSAAVLSHRYSFDADANDSVGNADGSLHGSATVTNGAVNLDGTTNTWVGLPPDLFTNYDSITLEFWFADEGSPLTAYLFCFYGASMTSTTINYTIAGNALLSSPLAAPSILATPCVPHRTNHLVLTQDAASKKVKLFLNDLLIGQKTNTDASPILVGPTPNDILGLNGYKGSILEFRTYWGALSELQIAVAGAFGPEVLPGDPGELTHLTLSADSQMIPDASQQAIGLADFANVTNVNVTRVPGFVLASNNTNIVQVLSGQKLHACTNGLATITASYGGLSNSVAITVAEPVFPELAHRYSFSEPAGSTYCADSIGGANGRVVIVGTNQAQFVNGQLWLPGDVRSSRFPPVPSTYSYVDLPDGIISSKGEITVETWVNMDAYDTGSLAFGWMRIFDFGTNTQNYLFLCPRVGIEFPPIYVLRAAITTTGNNNETRLNWTNALPTNVQSQVVFTYNPNGNQSRLFVNGALADSTNAPIPLSAIFDVNNWLGRSEFSGDSMFRGYYNEFRIYRGVMSDAAVAASFAAGPDVIGLDMLTWTFNGNFLLLSWGESFGPSALQSSASLASDAAWSAWPEPASLQDGRWRVSVPLTQNTMFFRLDPTAY